MSPEQVLTDVLKKLQKTMHEVPSADAKRLLEAHEAIREVRENNTTEKRARRLYGQLGGKCA